MNYAFQACSVWSLPPGAPAGAPALPGGCDFSRDALPALEEQMPPAFSGIDECRGMDGGVFGFGPRNFNGNRLPGGGPLLEGATCAAPNTTNISFDVNRDSDPPDNQPLGNLPGYDDWDNLVYAFQGDPTFTNGNASPVADEPDAKILEDSRREMAAAVAPDLSVDKTGPAGASPGDRVIRTTSGSRTSETGRRSTSLLATRGPTARRRRSTSATSRWAPRRSASSASTSRAPPRTAAS